MEEDKVKCKAKYFIPIYGGMSFWSDNKECELNTVGEAIKFASLGGIMCLYHYGTFAAAYFHKEIVQGLENLLK